MSVEESAEELYENAPCGYLSTRPDGLILRVNSTFLSWTGYSREELVGSRRLQELLTVGARVFYETHVGPLLQMQGKVSQVSLDLTGRDGRVLPILLNTDVKRDADGAAAILRSTVFDVTDRRSYERELLAQRKRAEASARRAALAAEIGRAMIRPSGLGDQLSLCARALVDHLDATLVRIWLARSEGLQLGAVAGSVEDPRTSPPDRERAAAERSAPLFLEGTRTLAQDGEAWISREGVETFAALPIRIGERLLGVLAIYARGSLPTELREALEATGNELAVGISRSFAEEERDALLLRTQQQAQALSRSQDLLETTLRSIGDGVISTDASARVAFMNPVAEALTGWSSADALGRPLREVFVILHELSRRPVPNPIEEALAQNQIVELANHTVLVRRDGRELSIADSAAPIRGPSGEAIGGVLVFRDVTEHHRAQRELQSAQQRLSTVVRNAPVILFSIDLAGRILLSEGKGLASLGLDPAERIGLSVFEVYAEVPWLLAEFRRALSGEAFLGGGELSGLQLETHYAPILDPAGVVSGAVGLALDVSERKRHEETIARTVQFEKQLIGIVSHDLRNPISAIALGASLLMRRRQELDAASLRTVTRIQNAAQRVTLLIHDLLDFTQARLGNGIRVQPAPVALDEVVREAVEELESAHPGRKISLSIEGDLRGEWDAGRVGQVVANLGSNALKYSPPESMVKVALAGDGDWITLAVHNGGDPIPSDLQTAIFQPMVRGMDEDSSGRSVGLGLYIVKQIVEAHGGAVGVRSDAQTGTTFTVRLPRIAARAVA